MIEVERIVVLENRPRTISWLGLRVLALRQLVQDGGLVYPAALGAPMFRRTLSILAAFVVTATITVSNVYAQSSRGLEGVTMVSIKAAIAKAIGAAGDTIELSGTARIFTVTVVMQVH